MLTISAIAGSGSSYYIEGKTRLGDYYLKEANHTYWGGGAKDALNLDTGPIKSEDFDRLMQGYVSTEERIGNPSKDGEWNHNPGRDLTFSDPKSVSILMQGPLRNEILKLRRHAVEKAMSYGEKHFAKARVKGQLVGNQKTVWAAVNEETSRANDPNGHTHVVLFNILEGEDGKFRALDNPLYYKNQVLLGQIYRSELAKGIKRLGFKIEATGQHGQWEIEDIPKDIRDNFSKRRQAIVEKINPKNDTVKARENICLITRPNKQIIIRAKLLKDWSKELQSKGTSFEKLSKPIDPQLKNEPFRIAKQVRTSMNIIAETSPHVSKHRLYRDIMDRTDGHFTIDQIQEEVSSQINKGFLTESKDCEHLARSVDLRREKQIKAALEKGHLRSRPLVNEKELTDALSLTNLKEDQKAAIRLFTRSSSTYVKIQGDAGTGKTTALQTSIPLIRQSGFKVIGLSTTNESTDELEKTGAFDKVMTLQKYLLVPEGDKKTVLVVDESSMIGNEQMISLLSFANKKNMPRVLFQGDAKQMSGVQAGEPFKHMEKSGVRSVVMNEIIRQKDVRHRKAITNLTLQNIKAAFEELKPEIHEISPDKHMEHTIKAWASTKNPKTPIIVQTNKQKNAINSSVKAHLLKNRANRNNVTLKTWQPVYKTDTEKSLVRSYKDATHIRFNRDYKRFNIQRGDIYKIDAIDQNKSELTLSHNNNQRKFNPALYKMGKGAVELYRQETRTLHEGDRIRFTRGGHHQPVNKNQMGTIKSIRNEHLTFEMDNTQAVTLSLKDKSIRHIDHAWASTTHAYQGKTVDHAVVLMPSRHSPLTSLQSLYTGSSRHRLSLTIITDDANKLSSSIEKNLNLENLEANIRWPEQEALAQKKLELEKQRSAQQVKVDKQKIELKFKAEKQYDISMGR